MTRVLFSVPCFFSHTWIYWKIQNTSVSSLVFSIHFLSRQELTLLWPIHLKLWPNCNGNLNRLLSFSLQGPHISSLLCFFTLFWTVRDFPGVSDLIILCDMVPELFTVSLDFGSFCVWEFQLQREDTVLKCHSYHSKSVPTNPMNPCCNIYWLFHQIWVQISLLGGCPLCLFSLFC